MLLVVLCVILLTVIVVIVYGGLFSTGNINTFRLVSYVIGDSTIPTRYLFYDYIRELYNIVPQKLK